MNLFFNIEFTILKKTKNKKKTKLEVVFRLKIVIILIEHYVNHVKHYSNIDYILLLTKKNVTKTTQKFRKIKIQSSLEEHVAN